MYKEMVELIKSVTGLDIPVYFDDMEANCIGSPYFGLGEHSWDILPPEEIDNPLVTIEDLIENKHLPYYHVGLPGNILNNKRDFMYEITQNQLKAHQLNIIITKPLLELFIILHEFGHAHELYVCYKGDIERYNEDNYVRKVENQYLMQVKGYSGTKEGLLLHKQLPTEQYADAFAIKYFPKVAELLKSKIKVS